MIVTEEEAETMWCPSTSITSPREMLQHYDKNTNTMKLEVHPGQTCIHRKCMWWQRVSEKKGQCGRASV